MLPPMHPLQPYSPPPVRHDPVPARARRPREQRVREQRRGGARGEREAERAQAAERVERRDDAVAVGVEERAVLLQDGLVRVCGGPAGGAERGVGGGRDVCAGGAYACATFEGREGGAHIGGGE